MTTRQRFVQALAVAEAPPRRAWQLWQELSGSQNAFEHLCSSSLLTPGERKRLDAADWPKIEAAWGPNVRCLEPDQLPELLRQAEGPPVLFADGLAECLDEPTVAIVGTRSASTYGKAHAAKFAGSLARSGVTVLSGGALGIDGAAHKGAIAVGGRTVAVLAGGIDTVYPYAHAGLFRQIASSGCLVSQFGLGVRPEEYRFLVRNWLIAALSLAVIVVEAPARSGALVTAGAAAELGRDVFVLPGAADNPNFLGSLNLIMDGATMVFRPEHVLNSLGINSVEPLEAVAADLNDEAKRIVALLSGQPIAIDIVIDRSSLDPSTVMSELLMLELDGRVIRSSEGYSLKP